MIELNVVLYKVEASNSNYMLFGTINLYLVITENNF